MDFFQGLLVILYIPTLISGNSTITTMFQDIKVFSVASGSWALAENLCQENGYRLFTMKNKSKQDALRQYVSKNGISTSTGFWLGMTEEPSGSSNWFWSDASQVQNESLLWKTGYPKPTVGQCVQINTFDGFFLFPASYEWQSNACSDTDPRIVCEKDMSSPCFYSDHNVPNVCPKSNFTFMKERVSDTALSLAECQQKCSIFQNKDYECWSLTFEPSSGTCVLYCYYSPFLLSEILPESGLFGIGFAQTCSNTNFQHKTCFSAVVDNTTLTATTCTTITSQTLTTTTQSTTNFPISANITTTLATVTTTSEPTTKFTTSATVEVPTMASSPTGQITSGSSITTNVLTSDSSATVVVSLSTTNKPTTSGVTNSRPKPLYLYPCPVTRCLKNSSNETLAQSIQRLTQELTISPNTTSAARRKKTCAEDIRSSAAAVGVVGIIILSVIGFLVVIPDVMGFIIHLKSCLSRK